MLDKNAVDFSGDVYYRLKQVDFGGNYEYSHIISVNSSSKQEEIPIIYPNPLSYNDQLLFVNYPFDKNEKILITVKNVLGELVFIENFDVIENQNNLTISATNLHLSPGNYFLQLQLGNEIKVKRLIIK